MYNTPFNDMFKSFEFYAFDGGLSGLGETLFMSTSSHVFANHACDHKPNFKGLATELPYTGTLWEMWNPVGDRIRTEINHVTIAARDIKQGEMITDDYTDFDNWFKNKYDENGISVSTQIQTWCGEAA
jgi:hypothetical protein